MHVLVLTSEWSYYVHGTNTIIFWTVTHQSVADQPYEHNDAEEQGHHDGNYFLCEVQWQLVFVISNIVAEAEGQAEVGRCVYAAAVAKSRNSCPRWRVDCCSLGHLDCFHALHTQRTDMIGVEATAFSNFWLILREILSPCHAYFTK